VASGACELCGRHFEKRNNANRYCSLECRFWSKVEKRDQSECWSWLGGKNKNGYGSFNIGLTKAEGKIVNAHRVAYELGSGVPLSTLKPKQWGDLYVCHTCDNRNCVNPRHLYLGSHATNTKDMDDRGRRVPRADRKFTAGQIAEVFRLRGLKKSQQNIASQTGISQSVVSEMLRGKYIEKG
jgi:hypothetical protein